MIPDMGGAGPADASRTLRQHDLPVKTVYPPTGSPLEQPGRSDEQVRWRPEAGVVSSANLRGAWPRRRAAGPPGSRAT
jgi:hypothetical protein